MLTIMEAIKGRKSIRKYADKPLPKEVLQEVQQIINTSQRLYPEIPMELHLVQDGKKIQEIMVGLIGNFGKISAPHFIVVTAEEREGHMENAGFTLESVVLELTRRGVATLWMGGHVKEDQLHTAISIPQGQKMVILLALGYPADQENFLRKSPAEAKRKDIGEFVSGELTGPWQEIMQAVQIAPSAGNSQPWLFAIEGKNVHAYVNQKIGFVAKKIFGKVSRLDVGIAVNHLYIAAKHHGKNLEFHRLSGKERADADYLISATEK